MQQHRLAVAACPIDFIDKNQRRDAKLLQGPPEVARLRLHPFRGGDYQHRAVQRAERTLYLTGEIHMARGVDEVDLHALVTQTGRSCFHGDSPLALHLQPVGLRGSPVHAAGLPDAAAQIEQLLRNRGFPGVNMGQNAEVHHLLLQSGALLSIAEADLVNHF
ncbi:Uncharacterised protein [uncultured Ruminococcus sp.]|nr:Uncharacterised protein [uncultured Ruminococcus sp.]